MDKIFKQPNHRRMAEKLILQVVKLSTFSDNAYYNPLRDKWFNYKTPMYEIIDAHSEPSWDTSTRGPEYIFRSVTNTRRQNIIRGLTKVNEGIVAGHLASLKMFGNDEDFRYAYKLLLKDASTSLIPVDMGVVYKMVKSVTDVTEAEIAPPKNQVAKATQKVIDMWEYDLATSENKFCDKPASYKLYTSKDTYKAFKQACDISQTRISNLISLKVQWLASDAYSAMCWCIIAMVSPARLLNYIGHYLTSRDGQPQEFKKRNQYTQLLEVAKVSEETGEVVGYRNAPPKFTAGFIHEFSKLIKEVDFKAPLVDDEFLDLTLMFNLEDFVMPETLQWKEIPLTKGDKDYYSAMGVTSLNEETQLQLNVKATKSKVKSTKEDNAKLVATGNPLFDMIINNKED